MYRQIWVSDEDTWMQCILWRDHRTQPMQTYRLRTVTYGEAASSYLACRALQEAGEEVRASSPAVADAIRHGFYVDNLSLGAATSEELRVLCSGVEQALLRRVNNFKAKAPTQRAKHPGLAVLTGPLTRDDLEDGLLRLLRGMQTTVYPNEVHQMLTTGSISQTNHMQHLNPVCINGLIHVQGRLQNADLTPEARLPILVPKSHPFSRVIIRNIHERLYHAGVALVIAEFRTRYWMRDIRRTVVGVLARCVPCAKARPHPFAQQMGPLPVPRVNASPPFTHTGVDLCGPFVVLPGMKGYRSIDVYVCIFVCFATKAVHLEVVEDQSTQAFISGLMSGRFVSLRGKPNVIHCDNGRNFIGAARELQRMRDAFDDPQFQRSIIEGAAEEGIRFAFIPPRSPNFGGLWEANIKVAKRLLKAAAHGAQLRMIEMQTLMHQISAILNSRPLTAVRTAPEVVEHRRTF
ncbi:uncharacterized protein LOC118468338 [Anopheles albimanus]|uniref:uncharacterized protein LOC118468338 n=1 Tax=Anopheles albimanus TaxID=7167 RepID=UPI00163E2AF1|nr:uncharacterized protein LOC118468338 [Anopheles albimanus]